jgi:hypothetical protein
MTLISVIHATEGRQKEVVPTIEFLEFLSEWETDQGEWEGPALFEDDSFDQLYEDNTNNADDEVEHDE